MNAVTHTPRPRPGGGGGQERRGPCAHAGAGRAGLRVPCPVSRGGSLLRAGRGRDRRCRKSLALWGLDPGVPSTSEVGRQPMLAGPSGAPSSWRVMVLSGELAPPVAS